jgi:hypothetical protein
VKVHAEIGAGPIALLPESYSAHRTTVIRETATNLSITLHFITPGVTHECQLLDRIVFGVLRSQAKRFFHERFRANPYQRRTKMDAVTDMPTAWGLLEVSVIDSAWDIYIE